MTLVELQQFSTNNRPQCRSEEHHAVAAQAQILEELAVEAAEDLEAEVVVVVVSSRETMALQTRF